MKVTTGTMHNIEDLVHKCQQGQLDAFSELFNLYRHRVFDIACVILRDENEAEDMVQETFLTIFQKIGSYEGQSTFESWLVAIVVNRCRSHLRKRKIRNSFSLEQLTPRRLFRQSGSREDVADIVHRRQNRQSFWNMVNQLDDRLRLPLIMRYRYAYSCDEIAMILDRRTSTIYQYLNEGRKLLARELQQQESACKTMPVEIAN